MLFFGGLFLFVKFLLVSFLYLYNHSMIKFTSLSEFLLFLKVEAVLTVKFSVASPRAQSGGIVLSSLVVHQ